MCHRKGNGREWSGSIVGEEAKENVPVVSGKTKYAIMKNTLFHREREKERERKRERERERELERERERERACTALHPSTPLKRLKLTSKHSIT